MGTLPTSRAFSPLMALRVPAASLSPASQLLLLDSGSLPCPPCLTPHGSHNTDSIRPDEKADTCLAEGPHCLAVKTGPLLSPLDQETVQAQQLRLFGGDRKHANPNSAEPPRSQPTATTRPGGWKKCGHSAATLVALGGWCLPARQGWGSPPELANAT